MSDMDWAIKLGDRVDHYIWDGKQVRPAKSWLEWGKWYQIANRRVDQTELDTPDGKFLVSTVFLGVDHNFLQNGPPILWETMVFPVDSLDDQEMERYTSERAARKGHARMVARWSKGRPTDGQ